MTDALGNVSNTLVVSEFEIDTTGPVLAEVTAIASPGNTSEPAYTFSSTQAGFITYGGLCSSDTDKAISGDNTVNYAALSDGVYSDCTVNVADPVGNASNTLTLSEFTVDTLAPTVTSITAPVTQSNTAFTLTVVFSEPVTGFDTDSDLTVENGTAGAPTEIDPLDGTTYQVAIVPASDFDGTLTVSVIEGAASDLSGNASTASAELSITVDTAAPTIEISADTTVLGLDDSATITFTLSEPTTDFEASDVTTISGALSQFDGAGAVYTAVFTPAIGFASNGGVGTISVDAGSFTDSFGNENSASNRLEIDFSAALVERTTRIINNFMVRRADQITANEPNLSNRLIRTAGGASTAGRLTGQGDFRSSNQLAFATSLSQVAAYQQRDQRAQSAYTNGDLFGFGARPMAQTHGDFPLDVWLSGTYAHIDNDTAASTVGLLHGGVDFALYPELVIGLMGQMDWTEEEDDTEHFSASGLGWLVGPYFVAEIADGLTWDARYAWGQSDNDIRPFETYEDQFETDRWLASSNLTGGLRLGDLNLRPQLGVIYFEETQKGFTDSNALYIPEKDISLGRLTFSPNVTHSFAAPNDATLITNWTVTGMWDFETADLVNLDSGIFADSDNDLRARTEFGFLLRMKSGVSFGADGFYDGIGVMDYQAYGGTIKLSIPLQ